MKNLAQHLAAIKIAGRQARQSKIAEKFHKAGLRGAFGPGKEKRIKKRPYVPGEGAGAPTLTNRGIAFRDGSRMHRYSDGSLRRNRIVEEKK